MGLACPLGQCSSGASWHLQAPHLEDLSSRLELVALFPVGEEVNGLAYVVPGILDLKTQPTQWSLSHTLLALALELLLHRASAGPHAHGFLPTLPGWVQCGVCRPGSAPRSSPSRGETIESKHAG